MLKLVFTHEWPSDGVTRPVLLAAVCYPLLRTEAFALAVHGTKYKSHRHSTLSREAEKTFGLGCAHIGFEWMGRLTLSLLHSGLPVSVDCNLHFYLLKRCVGTIGPGSYPIGKWRFSSQWTLWAMMTVSLRPSLCLRPRVQMLVSVDSVLYFSSWLPWIFHSEAKGKAKASAKPSKKDKGIEPKGKGTGKGSKKTVDKTVDKTKKKPKVKGKKAMKKVPQECKADESQKVSESDAPMKRPSALKRPAASSSRFDSFCSPSGLGMWQFFQTVCVMREKHMLAVHTRRPDQQSVNVQERQVGH